MGRMGGWMGEYRKEEEEGAVPPIPRAVILLLHRFLYLWRWVGGWVGGERLTRSKAQVTSSLLSLLLNSIVTSRPLRSYLRKGAAMPMLFYVGEWVGGVGGCMEDFPFPSPPLPRIDDVARSLLAWPPPTSSVSWQHQDPLPLLLLSRGIGRSSPTFLFLFLLLLSSTPPPTPWGRNCLCPLVPCPPPCLHACIHANAAAASLSPMYLPDIFVGPEVVEEGLAEGQD